MSEYQEQMRAGFCKLNGETVARLFTAYHGMLLLSDGFHRYLQANGYLKPAEELEDNCKNGRYDCGTCMNNGTCVNQGEDGHPFWEECDKDCESCLYTRICQETQA